MTRDIEIGEYVLIPEKLKIKIEASESDSYEKYLQSGINICGIEIKDGDIYLKLAYSTSLMEGFWRSDFLTIRVGGIFMIMTLYTIESRPNYLGSKYYHGFGMVFSEVRDSEYIIAKLIQ